MNTPEELVKESKHFCILPWIHFHAWPDKRVLPCCVADSSKPVSKIEDGQSILEMMNSEEYKKMRLMMLNDEAYEPCTRCYELEKMGTWTMRQSQNRVRGMDQLDIIASTNDDGSLNEFHLKYMDIRFSNICNMVCRSCGPSCSSLWAAETLKSVDNDMNHLIEVFNLDDVVVANTKGNDFMDQLKKHLPQVQECYFAGGEILVTPDHYECLDFWVENDLAKDIHLNYTTNMSKLTYKDKNGTRDLFDYWKKFGKIEIWASLDTLGETAEFVRKGTHWDRVMKNLRRIRDEMPNAKLGVTPTISLWNVWTYDQLFDTLWEEGIINIDNPPRLNVLTKPDHARVSNLPLKFVYPLVAKYEKQMNRYTKLLTDAGHPEHKITELTNTFRIILNALKSARPSGEPVLLREFLQNNARLDKLRDEDIFAALPEIKEVKEWLDRDK